MTTPPNTKKSTGLKLNLWLLGLARNWIRIALVIIGIYASLPFVAPTLMKVGATGVANVIYTIYSPMCHQFAFRSVFLYGDQPFYPREIAGTEYRSYEDVASQVEELVSPEAPTDFSIDFWMPARSFVGNDTVGYKTALCARDAAIYIALFFGGVIFALNRRKIRPLPFWIYVIAGIGPIGLDGFSQLLSYEPFNLWDVRETAPFFRVATGAMFGLMNAWLAFPHIEISMQETRRDIEAKLHRAGYGHLL